MCSNERGIFFVVIKNDASLNDVVKNKVSSFPASRIQKWTALKYNSTGLRLLEHDFSAYSTISPVQYGGLY